MKVKLPFGIEITRKQKRSSFQNEGGWEVWGGTGTPQNTAALNISSIWAAVNLVSGHIGALNFVLYKRRPDGGRERAKDHPLYDVLLNSPNSRMTAFSWKQAQVGHIELWGDWYTYIDRPRFSKIELLPLLPDRTRMVKANNGNYKYVTTVNGKRYDIEPYKILHVPGFGYSGLAGYNPVAMMKRSINLIDAAEESAYRYFINDASPGGVLTTKQRFRGKDDEKYLRLKQEWAESHEGLDRRGKVAILQEGEEYKPFEFSVEETQMLSTRKFGVTEIARWFNVPPHKLKDLEKATYSNIEWQGIDYYQDSLFPRLVRIEQSFARALLTKEERKEYYIEAQIEGLLRADQKSQNEALEIQRRNGIINADEWRRKTNQNPLGGEAGKTYFVPVNWAPAEFIADNFKQKEPEEEKPATEEEPSPTPARSKRSHRRSQTADVQAVLARRKITKIHQRLIKNVYQTLIDDEISAVKDAISEHLQERDNDSFREWVHEFYKKHLPILQTRITPFLVQFADDIKEASQEEIEAEDQDINASVIDFSRTYAQAFSIRAIEESQKQLFGAIKQAEEEEKPETEALDELLAGWSTLRAAKAIDSEILRAENAFTKQTYKLCGITKVRAVKTGKDTCPYCNNLDGTVIGIEKNFIEKGESFQPDGADAPLIPHRNVGHPPFHRGCDCGILAE